MLVGGLVVLFEAAVISALAGEALKHVGLSDKENRLPSEISGGEQERVDNAAVQ